MNKENEIELTPKDDIVFKRLFGKKGNEDILKDFLMAVLDVEIESIEVDKETHLTPDKIEDKLGVLDVRATLKDGTEIDIEMQNKDNKDIDKRATYYLSRLYAEQLHKGKDYYELNKAIVIVLLNFKYFSDIKEYHTIWKMREQNNIDKTLELQEIHFIELPKFLEKKYDSQKKIEQWLVFIDYSRRELVKMAKEKNEEIKKADEELEYLTGDEDVKRIAYLKRKFELEQASALHYARQEGIEKGKKEGLEQGLEKGKENGKKEEKKGIAKNMLELGIDKETIQKATGLTLDELEKL